MTNSWFNAYYGAYAAPHLMNHMATDDSCTVISGGSVVVERATCIQRHAEVVDEFNDTGEEARVERLTVDLLINDSTTFKGLADTFTNAKVILYSSDTATEGTRYNIDRIDNMTATFQRIELTRKLPRGKSRQGFYSN